jgi:hypothetical protein
VLPDPSGETAASVRAPRMSTGLPASPVEPPAAVVPPLAVLPPAEESPLFDEPPVGLALPVEAEPPEPTDPPAAWPPVDVLSGSALLPPDALVSLVALLPPFALLPPVPAAPLLVAETVLADRVPPVPDRLVGSVGSPTQAGNSIRTQNRPRNVFCLSCMFDLRLRGSRQQSPSLVPTPRGNQA